jgi:hypothetical protein
VIATKAASTGFLTASSAAKNFVFSVSAGPVAQSTLSIINTSLTTTVGNNVTLLTSGGSGSGSLSFAANGVGCLIANDVLSATAAATCVVTATKAASTGYLITSSAAVTFNFITNTVNGVTPQTINVVGLLAARSGTSQVISALASSNLPVTFAAANTAICDVVSGSRVTTVLAKAGGTCSITATQAGNSTYASASATTSFAIISATDASQFILVLDSNGGSTGITSVIVAASAAAQSLPSPTNGSLALQGWAQGDVNGALVSSLYTVTADTVLVAKWA